MGDLNTRRSRIQGIEAEGLLQKIKVQVPEAELYRYSTSLRSMTQGRGTFTMEFGHYAPVSEEIAKSVMQTGR